jgi:EmrB/QacA subfamily drug resistance transporter
MAPIETCYLWAYSPTLTVSFRFLQPNSMTSSTAKTQPAAAVTLQASAAQVASPGLTLAVIAVGNFLSALDLFIVNLAFPAIRSDFPGVTSQNLSWVLTIYSIFFAALLVPAGRMADRFGRKRVFQIGLFLFALASTVCALAPNVGILIVARAVKGAGSALMIPTSLGLLLAAYPPARHKSMVGAWAAIGSVGAAMGPAIGGLLVHFDWRLIFLVNLPFAIPALWFSRKLKESARTQSGVPDLLGSAFFATAVGCFVAVISYGDEWGFASAATLGTAAVSAALFAIFVWRCLHHPVPALNLRVFRVPAFATAVVGLGIYYLGFSVSLIGGTLYLSQVWHWSLVEAGLGFAVGPAIAGLTAYFASRMRFSAAAMALVGCGFCAAATLFWYFNLGATGTYLVNYLPGLALLGLGAGTAQTGFLISGASSLGASEYSTGTGILNTARQVGGAIGVAVFIAIAGTAVTAPEFANAWLCIVVTSAVAAVAAFAMLRLTKD